ncbi:MAG: hypothetical protein ACHREM_20250 [Polyangiales bacterium]
MKPNAQDDSLPDLAPLFHASTAEMAQTRAPPVCLIETRDRAQLRAVARHPRLRPLLLGTLSDRYLVVDPACAEEVAVALRAGGFVVVASEGDAHGDAR